MSAETTLRQVDLCVEQSLTCFRAVDWLGSVAWIKDVGRYNEVGLVVISATIAAIIVSAMVFIWTTYPHFNIWRTGPDLVRNIPDQPWRMEVGTTIPHPLANSLPQGRSPTCQPRWSHYDSIYRTSMSSDDVFIYAWPSKGGVIILDHAEAVDLEFLGLDPLNPPTKRDPSQDNEDGFCRRLLLLGAKWWDSKARSDFIHAADEMDSRAILALEMGKAPIPTMRERRWVSVAWPKSGGLWVAEFDTNLWGIEEDHNLHPGGGARLKLARTMDERSKVLQDHFKPKFYKTIADYNGFAFINSWDEKSTGEVGPLRPLQPMV